MKGGLQQPYFMVCGLQAAAEKAPKLSKEEMRRLRQERDPNFGKAKGKGKGDADVNAMPPPARRQPPKRKKGLGFEVPACCPCFQLS